jgi:hypothetical protein
MSRHVSSITCPSSRGITRTLNWWLLCAVVDVGWSQGVWKFYQFKSNMPVKNVSLLNSAFVMAILNLTSRVHIAIVVTKPHRQLKHSSHSSCFSIIICTVMVVLNTVLYIFSILSDHQVITRYLSKHFLNQYRYINHLLHIRTKRCVFSLADRRGSGCLVRQTDQCDTALQTQLT